MPFMYSDPPTTITHIRPAVDQSHAGSGQVALKSGATFQITTPDAGGPDADFVVKYSYAMPHRKLGRTRVRMHEWLLSAI